MPADDHLLLADAALNASTHVILLDLSSVPPPPTGRAPGGLVTHAAVVPLPDFADFALELPACN